MKKQAKKKQQKKQEKKSRRGEMPTPESFEGWKRETFDIEGLAQRGVEVVDQILANRIPADRKTALALVICGLRRLSDDGAPLGIICEFFGAVMACLYDDGIRAAARGFRGQMNSLLQMRNASIAKLKEALFGPERAGPGKNEMTIPTPPEALGVPMVAVVYEHPPGCSNVQLSYHPDIRKAGTEGEPLAPAACWDKIEEAIKVARGTPFSVRDGERAN